MSSSRTLLQRTLKTSTFVLILAACTTLAAQAQAPVLTSVTPSTVAAGSSVTLTLTGSNFSSTAEVWIGGAPGSAFDFPTTVTNTFCFSSSCPITYVSSSQLKVTATFPNTGSIPVRVANGSAGSNALTVSVIPGTNNAVPSISSLSPASAVAGGGQFTLTVAGSNFVSGSVVQWNGSSRTTTFVSATQLTALISASDIATAGTIQVTVFNPTPGGGSSSSVSFVVNSVGVTPLPSITSLSPSSVTAGGAGFTLTVNGSGFTSSSIVQWNGASRTTTFVSSTQLTAVIPASDIANPGTVQITVFNPTGSGIGVGLPASFSVMAAANLVPAITSLSPSSATAGTSGFILTVNGSNFVSGSIVQVNGANRTTTFVSSTQLTVSILTADVAAAGTILITVSNPVGTISSVASYRILNPSPRISWISPGAVTTGGTDFSLTIYGANFTSGSVVQWNFSDLPTTFVSTNQVSVAVPAANIAGAGIVPISIRNPTPGGGLSAQWTLPITTSGVTTFPGGPQPPAQAPVALAIDPGLGRIYVAHRPLFRDIEVTSGLVASNIVSVVDQKTGVVLTTIGVGQTFNGELQGIAVDTGQHRVYVSNPEENTVSVIDGTTNTVIATIPVDSAPTGVAVDPDSAVAYIAGSRVTLIDTTKLSVITSIDIGGPANAVAFDRTTHLAYVLMANVSNYAVVGVDGVARSIARKITWSDPFSFYKRIAVDPGSKVYVGDYQNGTIQVVDISTSTLAFLTKITTPIYAEGIAVDPSSHLLYVADGPDNLVNVFNSSGVKQSPINVLRHPVAIAIDPASSRAYVANNYTDSLSVVNTQQNTVAGVFPLGATDFGLAWDSVNKRIYAANFVSDAVSVIDATTRKLTASWGSGGSSWPAGTKPSSSVSGGKTPQRGGGTWAVAADPGVQQLYALNATDGTLTVFSTVDGSIKAQVTLGKTDAGVVAVNLTTNMVYISSGTSLRNQVTVVSGRTNQLVTAITVGSQPVGVAIDEAAARVYVANELDGTISVIDSSKNQVTATWQLPASPLNNPWKLAVDPGLQRLYVTNPPPTYRDFTGLLVLDSTTGTFITKIASGSPTVAPPTVAPLAENVLVNVGTHHVFLADAGNGTVTVIDGTTNAVISTYVVSTAALGLALDSVSGTVYISNPADATISAIMDAAGSTSPSGPPFTISDRGGTTSVTGGSGASLSQGYGQILANTGSTTPSGVAIYDFRQNGVLVSETGVPATGTVTAGRIYAEIAGAVTTGLAIANPNNSVATISFEFTDATGNSAGKGSTTIPANQQITLFLNDKTLKVYTTATFQGTFSFTSTVPVAVVAIRGLVNERGDFLASILPVIDTTLAPPTGTVVIPYFFDGGGWTTQVLLVNPTDNPLSGTVQFIGPNGVPLGVTFTGTSSNTYSVPGRTSQKLVTSGVASPPASGSIRIIPNGSISPIVLVVFSFRPAGITVSETGVLVNSGTVFRMYVEASGAQSGNLQTGLAVANLSSAPASVTFDITDLTGAAVSGSGPVTVNLAGLGQSAKFLADLFPALPGPFQGVLRITTTSSAISVLGVRTRTNERAEFIFTTTPPVNESGPGTTSSLFFPQLADGGGYTTQFILFSGVAGQNLNGSLKFFGQNGQPWTLPVTTGSSTATPKPTITSISPTSGSVGTTVSVTIAGTNFVPGGTTIQMSGAGITVGKITVNSPTSLTTTFSIDSTAASGDRSVNVMTAGGVSNAVTFTVATTSSQAQVQKLVGTWVFTYTIASQHTETLKLGTVQQASDGSWLINGTSIGGFAVAGNYSSSLQKYVLLERVPNFLDDYWIFDFTGTDTVAGCFYQKNPGQGPNAYDLSTCNVSMTGQRTSPTAQ
jgi:YVTN family beta-propeller protein